MKLLIASDLHLELGEAWEPPPIDYDVLVLAGDIDAGTKGFERFRSRDGRPLIYVCGNHEYYGRSLQATLDELRALSSHDAHFLENSSVQIGDVRFLGATLWTDFELHGLAKRREVMATAAEQMADYDRIFVSKDGPKPVRLTPADTLRLHQESRAWVTCELAKSHAGPTVVVTHAAPSLQSIGLRFRTDLISASFASDLEAMIEEYQPELWVHGHTHNAADYHIGATRIVGNPKGYPGERFVGFRDGLVIEV
ncbi:metallophosphoesterase [Aromatoleum toluclasticum]|uniref:metallophosphoesterase n=1 Tax=Aromatoleum toluclasticum TaxID=92003 RepID=UPI001D197E7C|nr:metallophosphoesterase [Aromatoleum toluclasticum]MCC4118445.1 metallophosphoesterase [Aromatoleum toluclasticum]